MEGVGGGVDDMKVPLLFNGDHGKSNQNWQGRFHDSITLLKCDFSSKLPDKVRSGLDPETHFHLDRSKLRCSIEAGYGVRALTNAVFIVMAFTFCFHLPNCNSIGLSFSGYYSVAYIFLSIYAAVKSESIAIAASTLDSLLDLMAGGILCLTHSSMKNVNIYKYPIGKLRVQPVGIIIFAAVMATLGFQVLVQALKQLIKDKASEKMSTSQLVWLYSIMLTATGMKLVLWIYCRSSGNKIVRAYAKDHYFDVVTKVIGLVAAILGDEYYWWIDPVGAIILAIYTIKNRSGTVKDNAVSVIGKAAPPEVLQKLTWLVLRHHPQIKRVDTVRAYTFGVLYFVEVDIELPEELQLKEAHATEESLQIKIEELPEVERAFVHLDFECDHKPEHSVLVRLLSSQP